MARRTFRTCVAVTLLVGLFLLAYRWIAIIEFGNAEHVQSGLDGYLRLFYEQASAYRAKNGKWPATLREAMDQECTFSDPLNRASDRPYYYNPEANPGSKEILIAQPVPVGVEVWPFKETWQRGITADGTIVDVQPGDWAEKGGLRRKGRHH